MKRFKKDIRRPFIWLFLAGFVVVSFALFLSPPERPDISPYKKRIAKLEDIRKKKNEEQQKLYEQTDKELAGKIEELEKKIQKLELKAETLQSKRLLLERLR